MFAYGQAWATDSCTQSCQLRSNSGASRHVVLESQARGHGKTLLLGGAGQGELGSLLSVGGIVDVRTAGQIRYVRRLEAPAIAGRVVVQNADGVHEFHRSE